jgi:cell division protein FtsX
MMALLRALVYFLEEALTSLWRSRLINALSIGTIAVSLFVLGAFLTVASNLSAVVDRWTEKVRVTFFPPTPSSRTSAPAWWTSSAPSRRWRRWNW